MMIFDDVSNVKDIHAIWFVRVLLLHCPKYSRNCGDHFSWKVLWGICCACVSIFLFCVSVEPFLVII